MADNQFPRADENVGEFWMSISDLMSGLMVIFLFISVAYITNIAFTYERLQESLYEDLQEEFEDDLDEWGATIDRQKLSVRFQEPDVLFDTGEARINAMFRSILRDFFPRYIRILRRPEYRDEIAEIRIEGHTSSEWSASVTGLDAYIQNMELSQDRTRSVLGFVMRLPKSTDHQDWLTDHLTANGLSSSQPIIRNGREARSRSRRVEFRVRTDAEERIRSLVSSGGERSGGESAESRSAEGNSAEGNSSANEGAQ